MVDRLTHQPVRQVYTFYTVRPGDTVARIAKRFHDVAWLLRRRNGGLWNMGPGQQIRVLQWPFGTPYFAVRPYVTDRPQSYDVRPGDTLSAIAARMHTDPLTLSGQNGLGDGSLIYAGQRLVLHHYATHLHRTLVPGVPAERLHTGLLLTDVANLTGVDAALVKGLAWRYLPYPLDVKMLGRQSQRSQPEHIIFPETHVSKYRAACGGRTCKQAA